MKKLFAVIMAAAMIMSVFVFTANAANENEWEVYASASKYKDEYEKESDKPKIPGLRYTDAGVQMYTATTDELNAMNENAWGGLQLKEKVNIKNGFSMTVFADKFTDDASTDKWISFCIWTDPKATPGYTDNGTGWFCLVRPKATTVDLQSFIDTVTHNTALKSATANIYDGEALTLEVKNEGGKLVIYVNGVDMNATGFDKNFENNEAYISVVGHQGNRDEIVLTVTEVNGVKPTGNEEQKPFLPSDIEMPEEGPEVAENEPCWIWNKDEVEDGKPGQAMKAIVNDDGSLHITFDDSTAPMFTTSIKKYLYDAQKFPVWAIKFKGLDDICQASTLWYCAGNVYAARDDSNTPVMWGDCDYDEEDENSWRILAIDLTDENEWEGNIHGFRLDVAANTALAGEEIDIMWMGFFRNEKEAYTYAGYGDLYTKLYGTVEDTEEETKKDTSEDTAADTNAETADDVTTEEPGEVVTQDDVNSGKNGKSGLPAPALIGIICGAAAVIAAIVIIIILSKKKKA